MTDENNVKLEGKLYLIPSTLGETEIDNVIPPYVRNLVNQIDHYIVEEERTVRRYLRKLNIQKPIDQLKFYIFNEHSDTMQIPAFINLLKSGLNVGIISEAGCPCIADPGSPVVSAAHDHNIQVVPLVGPSSIFLALMASGFNGQNFAFHGYLPKERQARVRKIKEMESNAQKNNQTQLFMETPYRNNHLLEDLLQTCKDTMQLCIAQNVSCQTESIKTKSIAGWRKSMPDLNKIPVIFILFK